jgi:putative MATE family efflux protein
MLDEKRSPEALRHRDVVVAGSLDRAIFHLGAPAAMAALLQATFLIVDTFWIGRVGAVALAAVSTAGFLMWMAQTLGEGMATGAGAVLSHAVGAGSETSAGRASAAGLSLAVWSSLLVGAAGLVLARQSFVFMGTDADVTAAGVVYVWIILLGMPGYFLFAWISAAFRAAGDAQTPLRLLALAAGVNVICDPLLIFGPGPFPSLGVAGAALATVISWVAACGVGWRLLGRIGLRPPALAFLEPPREVWRALRVGLPLGLEGALFSAIYILLARVITGFGTPAVAALGVGHKLEALSYFICAGMSAAATTVVGQSLGAGASERASRAGWRVLFLTCLPVAAVTILLVSFPEAAMAVFIDEQAVISAGASYVLIIGLSELFMAAEVVLLGAFAGVQWTAAPVAIVVTLTAARVPIAAWLVWLGLGVEGVWIAIAGTTVLKGLLLVGLFAWLRGRGSES